MSETIKTFETELKNKLLFKSSSKVSPQVVLFKACKFFDLYNAGELNRKSFFKAIVKCGVIIDTYDLDTIYNYYDTQKTGKINYKNFTQNLLFNEQESLEDLNKSSLSLNIGQTPQSKNQSREQSQFDQKSQKSKLDQSAQQQQPPKQLQTYEQIFEFTQNQIRKNGISALLNFANQLKKTDVHKTHLITSEKLKDYLPFLNSKNIQILVNYYGPNIFGQINYAQLIYSLKGNMNQKRQRIIHQMFQMLDQRKQGEILILKLTHAYKKKQQIATFRKAIIAYENFQSIHDGIFTDEDFNDFFEFVSFTFSQDSSFQQFIKKSFFEQLEKSSASSRSSRQRQFGKLKQSSRIQPNKPGNFKKIKQRSPSPISNIDYSPKQKLQQSNYEKSQNMVSSKRSSNMSLQTPQQRQVEMILLRIKKRLGSKGSKGFLFFEKSIKHYDTDEDGQINLEQFKNVIKDQKIDITSTQAQIIFNIFIKKKNSGLINYQQLIKTLKGEQTPERKAIFQRMWQKVQDNYKNTNLMKIKACLAFRNHPDIQTGRRYDDEIFAQIKDTIMMIQDLNGTQRSDTVFKDDFLEYCQNLSISLPENQLFQSIATNFWKIQSNYRIEDQYAGSRKLFDPSTKGYLQDHHRYAIKGGTVTDNAPFGTFHGPTNYSTQHQRL